jgi:hypothetical protein
MSYKKMTPIASKHVGCLNCDRPYSELPMTAIIAVGFGDATVTLHGHKVYNEHETLQEGNEIWTVADAETEALKQPDQDWRIHLIGPLSERHYQRQGEAKWVLYEEGIGFA